MQLDADGTGDLVRFEVDFGAGGERLCDGIEGGGDVIVLGEEGGRTGSLRAQGSTGEQEQRGKDKSVVTFVTAGHRTPFVLLAALVGTNMRHSRYFIEKVKQASFGVGLCF
jgi:hypothetical protein